MPQVAKMYTDAERERALGIARGFEAIELPTVCDFAVYIHAMAICCSYGDGALTHPLCRAAAVRSEQDAYKTYLLAADLFAARVVNALRLRVSATFLDAGMIPRIDFRTMAEKAWTWGEVRHRLA